MSRGRLHFKHHSFGLKAKPELVHLHVKKGDVFADDGSYLHNSADKVRYVVDRVTPKGWVQLTKIKGLDRYPRWKKACVRLFYGNPEVTLNKYRYLVLMRDGKRVRTIPDAEKYAQAVEEEAPLLCGKRYFWYTRRVVVPTINPLVRGEIYLNGHISWDVKFGFTDPEKPLQIIDLNRHTGNALKDEDEFTPKTLKRDYSADVMIFLCCKAWNIPKDVALYLINWFWHAERAHYMDHYN
jgi:hypothetical protein